MTASLPILQVLLIVLLSLYSVVVLQPLPPCSALRLVLKQCTYDACRHCTTLTSLACAATSSGGAIMCKTGSTCTITKSTFTNATDTGFGGGGIYSQGKLVVSDTTFTDVSGNCNQAFHRCAHSSVVTLPVIACVIQNNLLVFLMRTTRTLRIRCSKSCMFTVYVDVCTALYTPSAFAYGGAVIAAADARATISRVNVSDAHSGFDGGAFLAESGAQLTLTTVRIVNATGTTSSQLYCCVLRVVRHAQLCCTTLCTLRAHCAKSNIAWQRLHVSLPSVMANVVALMCD
jgi:hypothetical protein